MSMEQQWLLTEDNNYLCANQQLLKKVLTFINQENHNIKILRVIDEEMVVVQADVNEITKLQSNFGKCLLVGPNEEVKPLNI